MKKVIVIGCPGSGKSTFSRQLSQITGLPIVYLDRLFWNADKTHVTRETFAARVCRAAEGNCWIIDGNYGKTLPVRLEKCDTVFFLDYPLEVCLAGAEARMGKARPDLPWVETEMDPEFLDYIREFHREQLPQLREMLVSCGADVISFRDRSQAEEYLAALRREVGQ